VSPALSDLPVRKVIKALESAGFSYARTKGSHAIYRMGKDGGSRPHAWRREARTLASILRQAGLTPGELLKLLD
jgi:predicted RNA binding protein YcfA (HicA-like mRNA interferase family)